MYNPRDIGLVGSQGSIPFSIIKDCHKTFFCFTQWLHLDTMLLKHLKRLIEIKVFEARIVSWYRKL